MRSGGSRLIRWLLAAALLVSAAAGLSPARLAGLPGAQAQTDLVAAAKAEGRVVVYGSLESPIFDVFQKLYEDRYGVSVQYFRAAANRLLDRVLTEVQVGRPQFDVVLTNLGPMRLMQRAGAFAAYASPSYAAFPPASRDRDGILSPPYRMVVVGILYNTRLVKAEDAPKTLQDLLQERWKGEIVMPDPTQHITTTVWLASLESVQGQQYRPFVERLARQVVLVDSFDPAWQKVAAGEFPLGISYVKYVYIMGKEGAPLDYVRLSPLFAEAHHVALGARAAHPSAGKLFIDLLTSRLGLTALAQAGEFVLAPGLYPPLKDADKLVIRPMKELDEPQIARWRDEFGNFFRKR